MFIYKINIPYLFLIPGAPNPLADTLTEFYDDVVAIPEDQRLAAKSTVEALMDYIVPRIAKLSNAIGL